MIADGVDASDDAIVAAVLLQIASVSDYRGDMRPAGMMVAMNSRGKNFLVYRWEDVASAGELKLTVGK